jgi:hypothetical protein
MKTSFVKEVTQRLQTTKKSMKEKGKSARKTSMKKLASKLQRTIIHILTFKMLMMYQSLKMLYSVTIRSKRTMASMKMTSVSKTLKVTFI